MDLKTSIQKKIDSKTKPIGSLGLIENIAQKIALIQKTTSPKLENPCIVIFAGDHGIAQEGVSNYPQDVTYQMVENFLNGGAAINVFSKNNDLNLIIVDSGVNYDFPNRKDLIHAKVSKGTKNFINQQAMSSSELDYCFELGERIVNEIHQNGSNIIGFGEMGIGNTSSASMIMSYILDLPLEECVGVGTGLNSTQLNKKISILKKSKEFHGSISSTKKILQTFAGFEIVQMCSGMLKAYEKNMVILVDGFIASCAFLSAKKINPNISDNAFFCHQSAEKGHSLLLKKLNSYPILNFDMRLGEGTGCALSYPIIASSVQFINEMASFESAKVSQKSND